MIISQEGYLKIYSPKQEVNLAMTTIFPMAF